MNYFQNYAKKPSRDKWLDKIFPPHIIAPSPKPIINLAVQPRHAKLPIGNAVPQSIKQSAPLHHQTPVTITMPKQGNPPPGYPLKAQTKVKLAVQPSSSNMVHQRVKRSPNRLSIGEKALPSFVQTYANDKVSSSAAKAEVNKNIKPSKRLGLTLVDAPRTRVARG